MIHEHNTGIFIFLNRLLEAERAGVKVLNNLLPHIQDDKVSELTKKFLQDEGMNCRILKTIIEKANGEVSSETGDFVEKVESLNSVEEKLELLIHGQEWVVKQIRKNRDLVLEVSDRLFLESIKIQHEENVDMLKKIIHSS